MDNFPNALVYCNVYLLQPEMLGLKYVNISQITDLTAHFVQHEWITARWTLHTL